jgi:hypothetical protein
MKSWLITLYDDRALLAKAKTIVPEPNLVAYQTIVVIMVVRHKSTSVEDRRNTVERLRLFSYTSKDGLLKLVKDTYGTGLLAGVIFPVLIRLVLCF